MPYGSNAELPEGVRNALPDAAEVQSMNSARAAAEIAYRVGIAEGLTHEEAMGEAGLGCGEECRLGEAQRRLGEGG